MWMAVCTFENSETPVLIPAVPILFSSASVTPWLLGRIAPERSAEA